VDSTETPAVAATEAVSDAADTKEEPAAPKPDFSANLAASTADEEARKRAERAKRFGIVVDQSEEDKKKAERAARFGEEATNAPSISGLDSALPERRERKRGREGAGDQQRDAKRQSTDGRRGGGRFKGRDRRRQGGGGGGGGGRGEGRQQNGGGAPRNILTDPAEKAKAEARAKRFGA
jgi:SAP domain-containing ribonucleoprotein